MPINVRPGYQNPLTMHKARPNIGANSPALSPEDSSAKDLKKLEQKKTDLQNEMLLLRSTSDNAATEETQQLLSEQLERVSDDLQAMRSETAAPPRGPARFDTYEPGQEQAASPGLYAPNKDESGKNVLFSPYFDLNEQQN